MQEQQDADIIHRVLQGDRSAYALLVDRYRHLVYTLALRMLNNTEDAEEAAQDVFIKAFHALRSYNGNGKFSTWLYTITRNTCISRSRSSKQPVLPQEEEKLARLAGHDESHNLQQEQAGRKKILAKAIDMLAADEAEIITLYYIQEQTVDELSKILGLSVSNIKVKLYRARKKLKEVLDRHYKNELAEYYHGK
ncbi:MAG: RNA polymerase sigma factor [Taibaiella sp.]|nr:RNA polymerase sigma factor [Taibaiella sp.]